MSRQFTRDFALEVAKGNIAGHTGVNKFGENPDITLDTTEDIWDNGGTYTFPTTVDITHLAQLVDQVAMRGGTIEVQGLDTNWDLTTQTKDLDATDTTTIVALTTALRRCFRLKVLEDVVTDQDIVARNVGGGTIYNLFLCLGFGGSNEQASRVRYLFSGAAVLFVLNYLYPDKAFISHCSSYPFDERPYPYSCGPLRPGDYQGSPWIVCYYPSP